ncbi:MAG TPA: tRNA-binding protein [Bacillota bacterium]|nr:tRNA-binding protein [Bacillota bacterium]
MITWEDFAKVDIRAGQIVRAEQFPRAVKPSYKLWVDFGAEIGIKQSSAQLTECYRMEDLSGRQVLGVVNFAPRNVAGFLSEVLILGLYSEQGVVLVAPERKVTNGDRLG